MLKSISLALGLFCLPGLAQNSTTKIDPAGPSHGDVAIGYSYVHIPDEALKNFDGVSLSGAYDFTKWVGIAADFDFAHANGNQSTEDLKTYTVGPRIYRRMGRYMPFGEILAGAATANFSQMLASISSTEFVFNALGAVDIGINKSGSFAVRPEVGYIYFHDGGNSGYNSGLRIGADLAYHF